MNTHHTPGPWFCHLGRGANPRFHIQTSGGYQIASTTELSRHSVAYEENAQREANARLIAAAPELLAALKEYVDRHEASAKDPSELVGLPEYEQAIDALRKATQP